MKVSIERAPGRDPIVRMRFTNISPEVEYLAVPRVDQQQMDGSYFQFRPEPPAYLGIQVKRAPYARDELLEVAPGETIEREVNLAELYDFTATQPEQVRYRAMHPTNKAGAPDVIASEWTPLGEPTDGPVAPTPTDFD
jgi:hypothetical protein